MITRPGLSPPSGKTDFVKQTKNFWARFRVRAGYPVAAIYVVLAAPTLRWMAIGAVVAAFGLITRAAAAGHLRKDQELATSGPYSRTRNPLYLGSALLAAGFILAGHSLWAGAVVASYFAVFYYAAIRTEEAHLRGRFGVEFDAYAARVSTFLPSFNPVTAEPPSPRAETIAAFSWEQYRRNREYRALIGTLAGLGVLGLRMWLRSRFGY
jgi:protein-S-isoprenylcysteine O-methyltransferase Ste14